MLELMFQEYELIGRERVWGGIYTGEHTADVVVPDSYPDVDRIIDAFGQLLVEDVHMRTDGANLEGKLQGGVLFGDEQGEVHSLPLSIPFSAKKDFAARVIL